MLDEAEAEYRSILAHARRESRAFRCSAQGLTLTKEAIASQDVDEAVRLQSLGLDVQAFNSLEAALKEDPDVHVPDSLSALLFRPFASAILLERTGYDDAARDAFKAAVTAHPGLYARVLRNPKHPHEIDVLSSEVRSNRGPNWWEEFRASVWPWVLFARDVVLVALALGLALLLLIFARRAVKASLRRPLRVDEISGPDAVTGLDGIKALLSERLWSLGDTDPDVALNLVTDFEATFSVDTAVTDVIPQGKYIQALLGLLQRALPQRGWTLSGYCVPDMANGAGLTLRITSRAGQVMSEVLLLTAEFSGEMAEGQAPEGTNADFYGLVTPAAVWTAYEVQEASGKDLSKRWPPPLSRNWKSFSLFAVGSRLQEEGKLEQARRLYVNALGADPQNTGALYDLATVDIQRGEWRSAWDGLARARALVQRDKRYVQNPMWYRILYMQAVIGLQAPAGAVIGGVAQ